MRARAHVQAAGLQGPRPPQHGISGRVCPRPRTLSSPGGAAPPGSRPVPAAPPPPCHDDGHHDVGPALVAAAVAVALGLVVVHPHAAAVRRRRFLFLAAAGLFLTAAAGTPPPTNRCANRHRSVGFDEDAFWDRESRLNDFDRVYRLPRPLFHSVLDRVKLRLVTLDADAARNSSGHTMPPLQRYVVALRFMAGGSVHDIRRAYG